MKKSSANLAVQGLKLFAVVVLLTIGQVSAQRVEHYNSPLYSPKTYDPNQAGVSNGLPPAMQKAGIEQRLNEQLPLDAVFKDENNQTVKLGDYFNRKRPVILAFVYYECPMLCNEVLNGLTGALKGLSFNAGKEFDVVAISFDARENDKPDLAKSKKEGYLKRYDKPGTDQGWHFLTGTQEEIDKVTQAVGFNYFYDQQTEQFAHAGGIMIITPEGRVSRYLYGISYAPKDIKFAVMESAESRIGSTAEQLMLYCYHYDPSTGKYGLSILKVIRYAGILTLIGLGAMFFVFWRRGKNKSADLR